MTRRTQWPQIASVAMIVTLLFSIRLATAQTVAVLPGEPSRVFGGVPRKITVTLRNQSDAMVKFAGGVRLVQTTSATAAPMPVQPWKTVSVLPGQTIVESATLDFPEVKAGTRFLVQWLDGTNRVMGVTDVMVYPTNLLAELKRLIGNERVLGVFDPDDRLKPSLRSGGIPFVDLGDTVFKEFRGQLAIVGPFESGTAMRESLPAEIQALARHGVPVVWFPPPSGRYDPPRPSFYRVPQDPSGVVVAQPDLVAALADDPGSQLNFVHLCKVALHPEPPELPDASPQP